MHNAATTIYPTRLAHDDLDDAVRRIAVDKALDKYATPAAMDEACDKLIDDMAADDIEAALATRGQGSDVRPIGTDGVMVAGLFAAVALLAVTFCIAFGW